MKAISGAILLPEELYSKSQGLKIKFSLEEIYLIGQCTAKERKEIIVELQEYLKAMESDMTELINRTIGKVEKLTNAELEIILNYPLEDS